MAGNGPKGPRHLVAGLLAGLFGLGVLAGCGSGGTKASSPTAAPGPSSPSSATTRPAATTTTGPTTTAPTTTAPTTTSAPAPSATTPPTTTLVGLVLSGAGSSFTAPASPTVVPYNPDCQSLIDPGFYGTCLVVTAPSGTIAAIVEHQQVNYQPGQPIAAGQERDLVYREVGDSWSLVLRRIPAANGAGLTQVYGSDVMRDSDPKAIFVEPAASPQYGDELDVVEGSGVVMLYRQLHGGFATVPSGGGLDTYVPDPVAGYDEASISYTNGAWRIVSTSHVSDSQARALSDQAFYDPQATTGTG